MITVSYETFSAVIRRKEEEEEEEETNTIYICR
jgi:hypothetical protein